MIVVPVLVLVIFQYLFGFSRKMEEEDRSRSLKMESEQQLKMRRRMEREERRRQMKLKAKFQTDEEEMAARIAVEERKLLIAQRKLESIRLLDELLERVKVNASIDNKLLLKLSRKCGIILDVMKCFKQMISTIRNCLIKNVVISLNLNVKYA